MEFIRVSEKEFPALKPLQCGYKAEIGEEAPGEEQFVSLFHAIGSGQIIFYGCVENDQLVGCCSITPTYSTFDYRRGGVLEDFYILPAYRHRGIARKLIQFAYLDSGASSLTVGCADCDLEMYRALGFRIPLGNLLAFDG